MILEKIKEANDVKQLSLSECEQLAQEIRDFLIRSLSEVYLFDSVQDTLRWVSPFGNLRIVAHLQLPEAYRSLSRPSSAPDAKAFPLRSF